MTLLNPALLSGLLLAAAPVILHLLLRRKPKPLVFPALRLVQQRRKQNLKRIQLRHIWLMLLRVLAIGLIVMALTRPSLPAANYAFNLREWLTLGAVVALGVGLYFWRVKQWERKSLPRHVFALRRASARGWITGGTLLSLLLLVGCPYQHRIAAEITSPTPTGQLDLPVAAVFLFDTSLSMTYQQEGQTRLEAAREVARHHMSELPNGSRVSITDTSNDNPVLFQPTLSAAQTRLDGLEPAALNVSLNDRLRTCLLAQEEDRRRTLAEQGNVAEEVRKDRFLRRVYVFTDLTQTPWRLGGSTLLQKEIERLETINVFLVDVGESAPLNRAVLQVKLSRQQVPVGGVATVSALVRADGAAAGDVTLELVRVLPGGDELPQGKAEQSLTPGTPTWVTFPLLTDLTGPACHGEVRIEASDPLAMDDARTFTIAVGEPPRVLVTAPTEETAGFWLALLNPQLPKFRTEFVRSSRLRDTDFSQFDVVYLINVPQLSDGDWSRLGRFVEQGGGVGLFLGSDAIKPSAYERAQAQAFLPARLEAVRERKDRRLSVDREEHPIFRKLADDGGVPILEADFYFDRYFVVRETPGAAVLATFDDGDGSPALVERLHSKGRSVLFSTAVDPARGAFSRWNNVTDLSQVLWPRIAFAESLTLYLSRSTDHVFNVTVGEDVALPMEPLDTVQSFLLRRPGLRQTSVSLLAGESELLINDADDVGFYALADSKNASGMIHGFSVGVSERESDLTRLSTEELDNLLGEGRYQVARSIGELDESISIADLGREVYGIALLLAIVAFLGEHMVANRFYEADEDLATASTSLNPPSRLAAPTAAPPGGTPASSGRPSASDHPETAPAPS